MNISYSNGGFVRKIGRKLLNKTLINSANFLKLKLNNSYFSLKRLVNYGTLDYFDAVLIETSTACNRKCSYCPNSIYGRGDLKNQTLMDMKLYKKIIDELAEIKFKGIIKPFYYNEPLLDKRLEEIARYTRQKLPENDIHIATNGDFLTYQRYLSLIKSGITSIHITTHRFGIPKHIQKLFEKIKNRDEKIRVHYIFLNEDSILDNRGGLVKVKNKNSVPRCLISPETFQISCDGNVFLCCNDYFRKYTFGNVKNERIMDIWGKPAYIKLRKELKNKKFKYEICRKCVGLN